MKKILAVFALGMLVTACSFGNSEEKTETPKPKPSVSKSAEKVYTINDFYFENDDKGLTLRALENEEFVQVLSTKKIESANIDDGILTFTEINAGKPNVQIINLEAYLDYLNQ